VEMIDASVSTMVMLLVGGNTGTETKTGWTAQAPGSHIYLLVTSVGSTSTWSPITYHIQIAKIPINDTNESDNQYSQAKSITLGSTHTGSTLCSTDASTHGSHVQDHYRFSLASAKTVTVLLTDAGLTAGDCVTVYLQSQHDAEYGSSHQHASGSTDMVSLTVDLASMYTTPHPPFPAGNWYVLVTNHTGGMLNYGEGSAPVCFKRPYRLTVKTD